MKVQSIIEDKLANGIDAMHLEVINESNNHNVPPGSESHFKVVIVSSAFEGQSLIARHRTINKILENELKNQIHALALHTYTESEWRERHGEAPMSPPCRGGSKAS